MKKDKKDNKIIKEKEEFVTETTPPVKNKKEKLVLSAFSMLCFVPE